MSQQATDNRQANDQLRAKLLDLARTHIDTKDAAHDFSHAYRVLKNAEKIARSEQGELAIVIPAALFHDVVNIPKDDPQAKLAPVKSAERAQEIIAQLDYYQHHELILKQVREVIVSCSFRHGASSHLLEAQIVHDADLLDATGAISIMRTFTSVGQMEAQLYHTDDPFCQQRTPAPLEYGLDLFFTRLMKVKDKMKTNAAKQLAQSRTSFLHNFLKQLATELPQAQYDIIEN